MKTISLYTGAGGLDLGLESAGLRPSICVEMDEDARTTLWINRPEWRQIEPGDIHAHRPEAVVEQAGLRRGEAALLSGGPPCQPFSKAALWVNGKTAGIEDTRARTIDAFIDVAEAALPQVILLENVRGITSGWSNGATEMLESGIERINRRHRTGYRWNVLRLNAAKYGVPQTRERICLLADRDGRRFEQPVETHGQMSGYDRVEPYVTAWDAIFDLDTDYWDNCLNPRGKWAELLPSIPEGHNYLWHTGRGGGIPIFGWRTRYWSFLLKLARNRPSWTIPACPGPAIGPFHWKSRLLSPQELCRLQTFPDQYEIHGTYRSKQRQIGNAVPPLLGEILGVEICRQWLGKQSKKKLEFLRVRCSQRKGRNGVHPVADKYRGLAGDHKPHPGTGKGPGAAKRSDVAGGSS